MSDEFIRRHLLIRIHDEFVSISITISKPVGITEKLYSLSVIFEHVEKYNANIRGIDEFNAVECALSYAEGICRNSVDPEFFTNNEESMFKSSEDFE